MITDKNKMFLMKFGSKEHLDTLLNASDDDGFKEYCIQNPNLSKEHIDKLVKSDDWDVKWALAKHPSLDNTHIDTMMNDQHPAIRRRVLQNPNISKEQITKLIGDSDSGVSLTATRIMARHDH